MSTNQVNKTCNKCGTEKPQSEFAKDKAFKDGYRPQCKSCRSIYAVEWKKKNRAKWYSSRSKTRRKNQVLNNIKKIALNKRNKDNLNMSYLKRLIRRKYNIKSKDVLEVNLYLEKMYCQIKSKQKKNEKAA